MLGLLGLVRPLNVVMMAMGALIGGLLASGAAALTGAAGVSLLTACIAAAAIGAGANAVNDLFDLEIDRINRPFRPLPSGTISPAGARATWAALSLMGILLATTISWLHASIAAASVALLYLYSAHLKRQPVVGNVAVAVVIGLALPFGGLAVIDASAGGSGPLLAGALFAFFTTLSREIIKDVEDASGDAVAGARTLPLVTGPRLAAYLAGALALLAVAGLPLALALQMPPWFLPLAIPVAALLIAAAWSMFGVMNDADRQRALAGRASKRMKSAMLVGLVALAIAAW
jgi:geranylgeranylglycerol-phosphate geranylgeranyltransferase